MTGFVTPSFATHQGAERAERILDVVRSSVLPMLAAPLKTLHGLAEAWSTYMAYLERRESDDELVALAQRDSRVMNEVIAASDRRGR